MPRTETLADGVTLYLGDCLEILPTLPKHDALITDPPYGVMLGGKINNARFDREAYADFQDTPEYVERVAVAAVTMALENVERGIVTTGVKNMWLYPKPSHVGSVFYPAASGCNAWGFSCWQPLFYYGKDPHGGKGSIADSFQSTEAAEKNGHPCPKPIRQMLWVVNRASLQNETILDPFMGSGTTGVAAVKMGRKFTGIEISERYFDIACKRIEQALAQPDMLVEAEKKPEQIGLI